MMWVTRVLGGWSVINCLSPRSHLISFVRPEKDEGMNRAQKRQMKGPDRVALVPSSLVPPCGASEEKERGIHEEKTGAQGLIVRPLASS